MLSVRPERLQAITFTDCIKEGIEDYRIEGHLKSARRLINEFRHLWDSLNAARGYPWELNPWVWRIEFEMVK